MGGGGSKASSIIRDTLSGVSGVTGKVGEMANNPIVSKVGSVASLAGALSGHPEIGMGISAVQHGAPLISEITGELAGDNRRQRSREDNEEIYYPTRFMPITKNNNPILNRRLAELQERQITRNAIGERNFSNSLYNSIPRMGGDKSTWSPSHRK